MAHPAPPPPLYPLFADLRGRRALVVGGGAVALRKTQALLEAGARVRIGAPELEPTLARWAEDGRIEYRAGLFEAAWLDDAWLAIAATGDVEVNRAVAAAGEARRVWVNVVDDAESSAFQVPARIERGRVQIAISSGGGAPMLARRLREKLETELDESLGALAELLTRERGLIRARFPDIAKRRRFFDRLLASRIPDLLRQQRPRRAQQDFDALLSRDAHAASAGSVVLVGAGPGDPGLLTLRGLRALNEADVILHDHLASDEVLRLARRDAERIDVGKRAGGDGPSQQRIHALMIEHARAGKRVVRLKGGDPFVFGRGGEELQALRAQGIAYEVVPGITAALACAAYAGIPLTHREHAQSLRWVTAHRKDSLDTIDWRSLAQERQTLAVYMGVAMLETLQSQLIAHGRSADTPFALIENGSRPEQRVVVGPLSELAERARLHSVASPALLIVGEVAGLAEKLHWFGDAPLKMRTHAEQLGEAA